MSGLIARLVKRRTAWVLVTLGVCGAATAFAIPACVAHFTLKVKNDTNESIFVHGHRNASSLNYGTVNIAAHATGRIYAGIFGNPDAIVVGTYHGPQWSFECSWADAKAHEPVIVRVDVGPGPNGTLQDNPQANCAMTKRRPEPSTPTPVGGVPTPYPGAVPFGVPVLPMPTPAPH